MIATKHTTVIDIFNDLTENMFNPDNLQEEAYNLYLELQEELDEFKKHYVEGEKGDLNEFRN